MSEGFDRPLDADEQKIVKEAFALVKTLFEHPLPAVARFDIRVATRLIRLRRMMQVAMEKDPIKKAKLRETEEAEREYLDGERISIPSKPHSSELGGSEPGGAEA